MLALFFVSLSVASAAGKDPAAGIKCFSHNTTHGGNGRLVDIYEIKEVMDKTVTAIRAGDMNMAGVMTEKLGLAYESSFENDHILQHIVEDVCKPNWPNEWRELVYKVMQFAADKLSVSHISIAALTLFKALKTGDQLNSPQGTFLFYAIRPFASNVDIDQCYRDAFDQVSRDLQEPVDSLMATWVDRILVDDPQYSFHQQHFNPFSEFNSGYYSPNSEIFNWFVNNNDIRSSLITAILVKSNNSVDRIVNASRMYFEPIPLLEQLVSTVRHSMDEDTRNQLSSSSGVRLALRLRELGTLEHSELPTAIKALVHHPNGVLLSQGSRHMATDRSNLTGWSPDTYGRARTVLLDEGGNEEAWMLEMVDAPHSLRIKHVQSGDYLYGGENRFCTNNSRPMFTLSRRQMTQEGTDLWHIAPHPDSHGVKFTIRNVYFNEYLYSDGQALSKSCNTWRLKGELPAGNDPAAYWTISAVLSSN